MDLVANFFSQLMIFFDKIKVYFLLLILCCSGFFAYKFYVSRLDAQASFQLSKLIATYSKIPQDPDTKKSSLELIVRKAEELSSEFSMSSVSSLFKLYKSQALYDLDDLSSAIKSLEDSISGIKDPLFKDLAKVKLLTFKLEKVSLENGNANEILKDLEKISFDGKKPADGFANFRLHEYYFVQGDLEKSKVYGNRFLKAYSESSGNGFGFMNFSQIVNQVKSRMETLI